MVVEPGMGVHVTPSGEVDALNVEPVRVISNQAGAVPVGLASLAVVPPWVERSCTLIPAPGETTTEYSGEPGSVVARTITPALAWVPELDWVTTRACTVPSPVRGCETNRNWSAVPEMSDPPPDTVQVPELGS